MMNRTIYAALLTCLLIVTLLSCGPSNDPKKAAHSDAPLVAISITPLNTQMANHSDQQFIATGIYADHSTRNITGFVTWDTTDAGVAAVSNAVDSKGLATSSTMGTTTISAMVSGISGTATVTVTPATLVSLSISPTKPGIARGTNQQFTATGAYSDNTTQNLTTAVVWSSSDPAVAAISNAAGSQGSAEGLSVGSATITAAIDNISVATSLAVTPATLVSLAVTPTNPGTAQGMSQQFTATGTYSDNTTQDLTATAIWNSSDPSVMTISSETGSQGSAAALAAGVATIMATVGNISAATNVNVTPAVLFSIEITPPDPSIALGTGRQFVATGTYSDKTKKDLTTSVAWYSSSVGVAAISNAAGSKGLAASVATGSTTIAASLGSVSGTTTLTVKPATLVSLAITPANPGIAGGTGQQFIATGTYSDNTTQNLTASVAWSSSNISVATISNAAGSQGSATAVAAGSVTITAASGGLSVSTTLTVTAATLSSIAVTPVNPSVTQGASQQFSANGTYSDMSTQNLTELVTWASSNAAVAPVSNAAGSKGLATAVSAGTALITATSGNAAGSAMLSVAAAAAAVKLTWNAPATYTDGSPLTIAGYYVYSGPASSFYTKVADAGNALFYTTGNLLPGAYYFAVTAYDAYGNESDYSNEVFVLIP